MRFQKSKVLFLLALFVLSILACVFASQDTLLFTTPDGSKKVGVGYPFPVVTAPDYGFLTVSTPTMALNLNTASRTNSLPVGTQRLTVYAYFGDVNYGGPDVASGLVDDFIASGTSHDFFPATSTPAYWLIGRTTTATVRLKAR